MVGLANDLEQSPGLGLADGSSLADSHNVADGGLVALVMRVKLPRAAHALLVQRMLDDAFNGYDDRFLHLVGNDLSRLALDVFGHLCLLLSLTKNGLDSGNLVFRFADARSVGGLAR